jgi:HSP20 family molecular chaperone IbpA
MAAIDPGTLMWTRACELIDRAERLHRQFFQPTAAPVRDLCWEPPVDIIETDSELLIGVALPGVDSSAVKVTVDSDTVMVTGFRRANTLARGSRVHRLEIPYGRFERRITFPASGLDLGRAEFADGCLMLTFSKQPVTEGRSDV